MINYIVKKMSLFLIKNKKIQSDELEIIEYGTEIIIHKILFIGLIVTFNILYTKYILISLLYILSYFNIRKLTGGYHANKMFSCLLIFLVSYFLLIYLESINLQIQIFFVLSAGLIYLLTIFFISPIDCDNKKLSLLKRKENKLKSVHNCTLWLFFSILLYWFKYYSLCLAIHYSIFIIVLFLIIGHMQKYLK